MYVVSTRREADEEFIYPSRASIFYSDTFLEVSQTSKDGHLPAS
jgi:hypothetical protein